MLKLLQLLSCRARQKKTIREEEEEEERARRENPALKRERDVVEYESISREIVDDKDLSANRPDDEVDNDDSSTTLCGSVSHKRRKILDSEEASPTCVLQTALFIGETDENYEQDDEFQIVEMGTDISVDSLNGCVEVVDSPNEYVEVVDSSSEPESLKHDEELENQQDQLLSLTKENVVSSQDYSVIKGVQSEDASHTTELVSASEVTSQCASLETAKMDANHEIESNDGCVVKSIEDEVAISAQLVENLDTALLDSDTAPEENKTENNLQTTVGNLENECVIPCTDSKAVDSNLEDREEILTKKIKLEELMKRLQQLQDHQQQNNADLKQHIIEDIEFTRDCVLEPWAQALLDGLQESPLKDEQNDKENDDNLAAKNYADISVVTWNEHSSMDESASVGSLSTYNNGKNKSDDSKRRRKKIKKKSRSPLLSEMDKQIDENTPTNEDIDCALQSENIKVINLEEIVNTALARFFDQGSTYTLKLLKKNSVIFRSVAEYGVANRAYWHATMTVRGKSWDPSAGSAGLGSTNDNYNWGNYGFSYDCHELVGRRMGKVVYRTKEVAKCALLFYVLKEIDPKGLWTKDIMSDHEEVCLLRKQDPTKTSTARWAAALIRKNGRVYLVDVKDKGYYRKPVFLCTYSKKRLLKNFVLTLNAMKRTSPRKSILNMS